MVINLQRKFIKITMLSLLIGEDLITVEEEVELAQRIRKGDRVALEKDVYKRQV